jgi:OsmC-like protein
VTHANKRGVDFRSLRIETRGDYDLSGYLGIDPKVPPGYLNITYSVEVDTDADPAVLEEIRAAAEKGSPVTQNVLHGTPIQSEIKKL